MAWCCSQEEYSEEEDEQDEDLSAALATLRLQQEGRAKDGSKRSGQIGGDKSVLIGGASEDSRSEGVVITQVSSSRHGMAGQNSIFWAISLW